jgi:hypothetical protein
MVESTDVERAIALCQQAEGQKGRSRVARGKPQISTTFTHLSPLERLRPDNFNKNSSCKKREDDLSL